MALIANYPPPTYLCKNVTTTGLQAGVLDITKAITARLPVVLQVNITGAATVQVLGGIEVSQAGAIVDPIDLSSGGFTVSDFYDLVLSLPFYQITIPANAGTVTVKAGQGAMGPGEVGTPNLLTFSNNATLGM